MALVSLVSFCLSKKKVTLSQHNICQWHRSTPSVDHCFRMVDLVSLLVE